ncbi:protein fuzzy homolog isoform X2 [Liolophura sinensis]
MAAYLFCLTAEGGVPLFSRTKGDLKPLPFPVIGSLNGVHMFASNQAVSLLSTTTDDAKVVWRVFHDSLTLIMVSGDDNACDCHFNQLLNLVFQSMVLVYGQDDLIHIKNVERFKKEIKVCYHMVDTLLSHDELSTFSDVTNAVDTILAPENQVLQAFLDAFVEAADSSYGCLLVHGKVAVATRKWWTFTSTELVLLSMIVAASPKCSSRDIPVFLPHTSPTVPHRLLTYQLMKGVEVCAVCGPNPSLASLEMEVGRFWRAAYESLKAVSRLHPRNFPTNMPIDQNILGFLLVNVESHKSLCTVQPMEEDTRKTGKTMGTMRRREILRSFYKYVVGTYFPSTIEGSSEEPSQFSHKVLETYITSDTHKCYAIQSGPHQMFALFQPCHPHLRNE